MNYSVQNLTQVADCDVLLGWANRKKAALDHKRYSEEQQAIRVAQTASEIAVLLQSLRANIAVEETIIAGLPDGPIKEGHIFDKKNLEHKVFLLEHRQAGYSIITQLEQEVDLGRVEQEIDEVDAFISAVTARRERLLA